MDLKMEPKSIKNDSQANPETRHQQKKQKASVSRPSKTLKIVLSSRRGAIFHKIAVFKESSKIL